MAAIITDDFRKNNIERFINDVKTSQSPGSTAVDYYVGIGKTDPWEKDALGFTEVNNKFSVPAPSGSEIEKADVKKNLMTLKKIQSTDVLRMVPQIEYKLGEKYKVFDPTDPSCFDADQNAEELPCYAIYLDADGNSKVYLCLSNGGGGLTSAAQPTTQVVPTMPSTNFPYGVVENVTDKYIWAYIDYFDKDNPSNLFGDSKTFINITENADVDTKVNNVAPHGAVSDGRTRAAKTSAGLVYGFKIKNQGALYPVNRTEAGSNALTGTLTGVRLDGTIIAGNESYATDIKFETDSDGKISKVIWSLAQGQALGYGRANVIKSDGTTASITGGVTNNGGIKELSVNITDGYSTKPTGFIEAEIQPLIAPIYGLGWSPLNDLPSYYCGISSDFKGTVGDESSASPAGTPPQYIGEALVDIGFRQVSVLKNTDKDLRLEEDDSPWPDATLDADAAINCLQYFQVAGATSVPAALQSIQSGNGAYIQNQATGEKAKAWFDKASKFEASDPVDGSSASGLQAGGYRIYFHQNSDKRINKRPFQANDTLDVYASWDATTPIVSNLAVHNLNQGEYKQDAGDVLFLDNRRPITRNAQQTEEVRIIIQF
jgi:hypothetical protein